MQGEHGVRDEPLTRAARRAAEEQSSRRSRGSRRSRTDPPREQLPAVPLPAAPVILSRADLPAHPEPLEEPLEPVSAASPPPAQSDGPTEPLANRGTRRAASRRGRRRRVLTVLVAVVLAVAGGVAAVWSGVLPDQLQAVGFGLPGASAATAPVDPAPSAQSATPATSPAAEAPAPASADERLLSTVDRCWALARGELAPASASYRALVASAGGSDLEAWCADLTGAPAHTAAAS